ncbi:MULTISPECIES: hypothetical protein [unclassified Rathayibacter]|uniref:hypothetical protein n=1 Tax=unclassified Rathayibacter TaxID=2609250 RepID=UPI00188A23E8|nr:MULTISPECIES: hypothetical protein [unclassified Rathayibacter]MBF4461927.1 hypothetical protein [Rathayibacter sp. VKM Ac-2879]MBF4504030.1 hypothetical protein [Rathayibacter sp. VKM Ac-2878]
MTDDHRNHDDAAGAPLPPRYGERVDPSSAAAPVVPASWEAPAVTPAAPTPHIARGVALALLVLPAGVLVWLALWQAGFVASIVGFGVAFGAGWLYRKGAPGPLDRRGVAAIVTIIIVTMVVSIVAGVVADTLTGIAPGAIARVVTSSHYWSWFFGTVLRDPQFLATNGTSLLFAVLFTVLGTFRTIRRLVRSAS